jgi:hypothetical protein
LKRNLKFCSQFYELYWKMQYSLYWIVFFIVWIVDGCEPGAPPPNGSSHHTAQNASPQSQTGPPTTTLLQNILQQNRTGSNGNIYSLQRQTQLATTTTTSPLPPSPADSGVSDVDSHYSSNDEQQQQMSQYGYFYGAQRSTCMYSQIIDSKCFINKIKLYHNFNESVKKGFKRESDLNLVFVWGKKT